MKQATDQNLQLGKWLGGAALGALVMYMLDPERGAPRRALSREKLRSLGRQTGSAFEKVVQEAGPRVAAMAQGSLGMGRNSDDQYQDRSQQRSLTGNDSSQRGREDLRAFHQDGADSKLARSGVQQHSSEYASQAGDAPARPRGATLAGASVLGMAGLLAPRSPIGMAMGLAGLALLVRATGKRPMQMLSGGERSRSVEVEKTIRIDASPEHLFDMFANYENFPRFMSNVIEVRDLGERRSHWVVKGPAGSHFAWNAILTEHDRPHRLAWESEPGAEVQQAGSIVFEPVHNATKVTVRMTYRPPAGALGHALASLMGSDPKRQMDEDLARMKSLVERGAMMQAGSRHASADSKFLH